MEKTPVSSDIVLGQLQWRYAVKKFDSQKKIPAPLWDALEKSLVLAPSSFGLQPWKFLVVTEATVKERLVAASWNQRQVADGSHHVVFAIKADLGAADVERYLKRVSSVRKTPLEALDGFRKVLLGFLAQPEEKFDVDDWSARQVYLALGQFMTAAAMLGVDTCPMEGIDPKKYDEILGLVPGGYRTVVACVAGYRAADDKYATMPKVRYEADEVVARM